jgi:hypothetical protein
MLRNYHESELLNLLPVFLNYHKRVNSNKRKRTKETKEIKEIKEESCIVVTTE